MRQAAVAAMLSLLTSSYALAQGVTPEQQQALSELAIIALANEACEMEGQEGPINAYLVSHGFREEDKDSEAIGTAFENEVEQVASAAQQDTEGFCDRAWALYGDEGTAARGLLKR